MHGQHHLLTDVLKGELRVSAASCVSRLGGHVDQLPGKPSQVESIEPVHQRRPRHVIMPNPERGPTWKPSHKPNNYVEFITDLKDLVQAGRVPMARIDDAVERILRVKLEMGIFDHPFANRSLLPEVGSPAHRAVARRAVRESLVLLKNDNHALPLAKTAHHLVLAGNGADDLGRQCGGWTISWQGEAGQPVEGGTSILAALKQAVGPACSVTYSADATDAKGADAGVVVLAEDPYAEGKGDRRDLNLKRADLAVLHNARASGAPVVLVLLSGRPLILGDALGLADAFVAAWLPGTEGAGVADVLIGDYAPTGKLSFSWPRSMAQIPINVGDTPYDPLFKFGYGLTFDGK